MFENASLVYEKPTLTLYREEIITDPLARAELPPEFASADMIENELRYFCRCLSRNGQPELCDPAETVKSIFVSCAESGSLAKHCAEPVRIPGDILCRT